GAGYYRYDPKTRARSTDPEVLAVIEEQASKYGVKRRELSEEEILDRHLMALINEGFRILEEGIAQRPSDIDAVYVHGYGFPSYRGGPMFYASRRGLKAVYECVENLYNRTGEAHWSPAPLLTKLVESNQTLEDWMANKG
ncbi:MAG: 3-hydroxyacyl-CoA dehydrogenase family protein, partial [Marinobacter sp.]